MVAHESEAPADAPNATVVSRRNPAGSSFWVGYSDLMTSLFFVFLVVATTLALGFRYQASIYETDARELARIREVAHAADALIENDRFFYNEPQSRFELKRIFEFKSRESVIPDTSRAALIAAGRDIEAVLRRARRGNTDVRFKVVIEGRTARFLDAKDAGKNADRYNRNKNLSYERALSLAALWEEAGIDFEAYDSELLVAGAGFEGKGRYPMVRGQEEKNKQIIVQVIPFLSPG